MIITFVTFSPFLVAMNDPYISLPHLDSRMKKMTRMGPQKPNQNPPHKDDIIIYLSISKPDFMRWWWPSFRNMGKPRLRPGQWPVNFAGKSMVFLWIPTKIIGSHGTHRSWSVPATPARNKIPCAWHWKKILDSDGYGGFFIVATSTSYVYTCNIHGCTVKINQH